MFTDRMVWRRKLNKGGCTTIKWLAIPAVLTAGVAAGWYIRKALSHQGGALYARLRERHHRDRAFYAAAIHRRLLHSLTFRLRRLHKTGRTIPHSSRFIAKPIVEAA